MRQNQRSGVWLQDLARLIAYTKGPKFGALDSGKSKILSLIIAVFWRIFEPKVRISEPNRVLVSLKVNWKCVGQ